MPELLLSNFRLLLMKLVLSITWRPMKMAESNSVLQHSATAPAVFTAERVTKAASVGTIFQRVNGHVVAACTTRIISAWRCLKSGLM